MSARRRGPNLLALMPETATRVRAACGPAKENALSAREFRIHTRAIAEVAIGAKVVSRPQARVRKTFIQVEPAEDFRPEALLDGLPSRG